MSKDDIAISENKTCARKTKSYARKSKNCARKITRNFWPLCAQISAELASKICAQCFEHNPRLSRLGLSSFWDIENGRNDYLKC